MKKSRLVICLLFVGVFIGTAINPAFAASTSSESSSIEVARASVGLSESSSIIIAAPIPAAPIPAAPDTGGDEPEASTSDSSLVITSSNTQSPLPAGTPNPDDGGDEGANSVTATLPNTNDEDDVVVSSTGGSGSTPDSTTGQEVSSDSLVTTNTPTGDPNDPNENDPGEDPIIWLEDENNNKITSPIVASEDTQLVCNQEDKNYAYLVKIVPVVEEGSGSVQFRFGDVLDCAVGALVAQDAIIVKLLIERALGSGVVKFLIDGINDMIRNGVINWINSRPSVILLKALKAVFFDLRGSLKLLAEAAGETLENALYALFGFSIGKNLLSYFGEEILDFAGRVVKLGIKMLEKIGDNMEKLVKGIMGKIRDSIESLSELIAKIKDFGWKEAIAVVGAIATKFVTGIISPIIDSVLWVVGISAKGLAAIVKSVASKLIPQYEYALTTKGAPLDLHRLEFSGNVEKVSFRTYSGKDLRVLVDTTTG